ncbi:THAP domain-containing protein 1-like [Dysidea avara]|uniref:THAP domain-containing protein 1-like n=1 Tax=Dysidea avara TaxID=196820 RepID=UPI003332E58B
MWHGDYCCVPDCRNSSGSNKKRIQLGLRRISYHSFPNIQSAKGKLWIKLIRRDPGTNFVVNKHTKICSAHFKPGDFTLPHELLEGRRRLKQCAVPSIFPWHDTKERRSLISVELEMEIIETPDLELSCDMDPECDSTPSNSDLLKENCDLKLKLVELQNQLDKSFFRLDSIKDDDSLIRLYTGFFDYGTLLAFYEEILEPDASVIRQWGGKRSGLDYDKSKVGPSFKLPLIEQFFYDTG